MSMRRVGGILAGVGITSQLLQPVGMQLMLFWFLDGVGPKLAVVFKVALVVTGILIWKHADESAPDVARCQSTVRRARGMWNFMGLDATVYADDDCEEELTSNHGCFRHSFSPPSKPAHLRRPNLGPGVMIRVSKHLNR